MGTLRVNTNAVTIADGHLVQRRRSASAITIGATGKPVRNVTIRDVYLTYEAEHLTKREVKALRRARRRRARGW